MLALKTIAGVFWRFAEELGRKGIGAIVTLLLALFVSPEDFGLISMIAIFIAVANCLMESGFKQAIIRKPHPTAQDFDTAFYTNLALSLLLYGALYGVAPLIGEFYGEPRLPDLIRVVALAIPINATQVVQYAILSRDLRFKTQLIASIPAAISSGTVSVVMAHWGYGVWALIAQVIVFSLVLTAIFWSMRLYRPGLNYSWRSLEEMFSFGIKLTLSELIATIFKNIYVVTIAKLFSANLAGYYFFADKIRDAVISSLVSSVQTATYPALSKIQKDDFRLKSGFRNIVRISAFAIFPVIALLAALTEPLFHLLLPKRWYPAITILQLMCVASILHPLHAINLDILKVKGRSDLVLYLEIYKKLVVTLILFITANFGVIAILVGQILCSILAYVPNSYFACRLTGYSVREQVRDYGPALLLSATTAATAYVLLRLTHWPASVELVVFGSMGILVYVVVSHLSRLEGYELAKEMGRYYFRTVRNHTPTDPVA